MSVVSECARKKKLLVEGNERVESSVGWRVYEDE